MKKKLIFLVPLMVLVLFSSTAVYAKDAIVEKIPIVDVGEVVEIPSTVVDVPQDNMSTDVQKIRVAIEILVYGAFPVCVAALIIVKLLSWFGKHYAK